MHPNAATITAFYEAFGRRDADAMVRCYAPDAHFSDPVFPDLHGDEVFTMWRMLAARAKDFSLTFRDVSADDTSGRAHWEARYLFSQTGRPVHNVIDATFTFAGGKISRHVDRFDLWKWSAQALGLSGTLLGWTPLVQGKIRAQARKGLESALKSG
ncbi:MAG TPA: nuclear transport factor 2 family protein [Polyangiaceae bacterium]|jgi:ketosteroid isomerase-like protein